MNGPEHYREAERLLQLADSPAGRAMRLDGDDLVAEAQVHATLALAAATVNAQPEGPLVDQPSAWDNNRQGDGATWSAVTR